MTASAPSDLDRDVQAELSQLPATATIVYLELHATRGPRTLRRLAYDINRPESSVHRALRQLHDAGLVSCSPRHDDPPTSEWSLADDSQNGTRGEV